MTLPHTPLSNSTPPTLPAALDDLLRQATGFHAAGDIGKARALYRQILAASPAHAEARWLRALTDIRAAATQRAIDDLTALCQTLPADARLRATLGGACLAAGQIAAASGHLYVAAALSAAEAQVPHLLAVAALAEQRRDAAERLLETALDLDPALHPARLLLVLLLVRQRRIAAAWQILKALPPGAASVDDNIAAVWRAFAPSETYLEAARELAAALQEAGRHADAIVACNLVIRLYPRQGRRHYDLAIALETAGRIDEAVAACRRAVALSPRAYPPHAKLGSLLLLQGRLPEAIAACRDCLALQPGHAHALGHLAIALDETGERAAAARLLDFDRFIRPHQFAETDAEGGLAQLNADLRQAIRDDPDLKRLGNSVLTRGWDLDGVFPAKRDPFTRLEALIRHGIVAYIDALPADAGHPFVASRPQRWWLKAWATVLESGGWQAAHLHMEGWLSGTYYIGVPDAVRHGNGEAGHLLFGKPPERLPLTAERRTMTVRPQEGLTVMFPSYVFHQTVPFASEQPRITVSYDLRPAD